MSDHIDGPRQIGDPSADLTDLFAFTSSENPGRTVLAANVFPTCGQDAIFSNAITHSIVVRRARVVGLGDAAKFETSDPGIRFSVRFGALERGPTDQKPVQRGTCSLPDGQTLSFIVNDEKGASTPDGTFRAFAGLRSDPFILAWIVSAMKPFQNLLQNDNVLCIVIEFDTRRVLDPDKGSLFGVIAETVPLTHLGEFVGTQPPRLDWVGRPEQTNMRLNCPLLRNDDDLRDLWNQQTPFAIDDKLRPLFLQRLKSSLNAYDMHDRKQDWTSAALAANANMFLDDFLLFDVAKPITDDSHLEIERSTLNGRAYQTGGGRTVDADVIDVLLTWMVNRDREPLRGGTTKATKPGTKTFPYFATPNTDLQSVADRIDLNAPPDRVWELIGQFGGNWHPLIASIRVIGTGIGQLRTIETIDGKRIIERLEAIDNSARLYRYSNIAGIPASDYTGILEVKPKWSRKFCGMARPVPGGWPGHPRGKNHCCHFVQDGSREPQAALWGFQMSAPPELDNGCLLTTDGEIAVINLESARRRSWSSFFRDPLREGIVETVVEHEQLTAQFVGDLSAFDRLEYLISHLVEADARSKRTALIQAQVASTTHRFADARRFLAHADLAGAQPADLNHLLLNIDQACGANLSKVLDKRREAARNPGRIADLVALGALLADLREFTDADRIYRHALQVYRDVSPFPVAWIYFQLGVLWGELVPEPQVVEAEGWYRKAIGCLPNYTKARVHLAEICLSSGRPDEAEVVLMPAVPSGDPEVLWRLADALVAQKRYVEAEAQLDAGRSGFEALLERHLLAFADHGADFYVGSGNNGRRALDLARINVANRPTLRAFEQAHDIAVNAGDPEAASDLLTEATIRWVSTPAFRSSYLSKASLEKQQGAAI